MHATFANPINAEYTSMGMHASRQVIGKTDIPRTGRQAGRQGDKQA